MAADVPLDHAHDTEVPPTLLNLLWRKQGRAYAEATKSAIS